MCVRPPTALAALTIAAIQKALDRQPVENTVRRALRDGMRTEVVSGARERAVVASAVYGTSQLRARLAYMLQTVKRKEGRVDGAPAALLLAIFLLHEEPQRVKREDVHTCLPPDALGLSPSCLAQLKTLNPQSIRWPNLATRYSMPCGLARVLVDQRGHRDGAAAMEALNAAGPVTLRVNTVVRPSGRQHLISHLERAGIGCRAGTLSPWSVILDGRVRSQWGGSVWNLEGWRDGAFEVQDEGSQCVAAACAAAPAESILDLCAGNGGKALALAAQVGPRGSVLAHDVVATRLAALRASAERAGVARIVETVASPRGDGGRAADADDVTYDERPLLDASHRLAPHGHDAVLVDAPCSSCGTLRRHPGLRWDGAWGGRSARAAARRGMPALQLSLLQQAARLVNPACGRLIYATCSLDRAENEAVALAFEKSTLPDGAPAASAAAAAIACSFEPWPFAEGTPGRHEDPDQKHFRTLWPHLHGTDGFFIARWRACGEGETRA